MMLGFKGSQMLGYIQEICSNVVSPLHIGAYLTLTLKMTGRMPSSSCGLI